jgi:hypothetical protein
MPSFNRRKFLAGATCSLIAARLRAQIRNAPVTLAIPEQAAGAKMPTDFVGLSYEVQQLVNPDFFSLRNSGLIRQFRDLARVGVLRLGGNTSEFATWKPSANAPDPERPKTREVAGEPRAQYYAVTPDAVRNLASFLHATGWRCIYGIGLGTNTPPRAAAEAAFAARTLGTSLEYFQIGNEVDLFDRHLRDPRTWNAQTYLDEWLAMARAITAAVPHAKFGMPDVASKVDWLTEIADRWASIPNPPHVVTLSHHYYFGGPATNPAVNIPNLLKPETMAKVQQTADSANADAKKMGVRLRMTEGNTCYRGGKPGVSDVFAAALWAADYALLLASNNYTGVNLHGGTGSSVANSVGGSLPGDTLLQQQGETRQQIASHPHPFYTPIATFGAEYLLEPVGYGLKFAGELSGCTFIASDLTARLQAAGANASAYAARLAGGRRSVVVINKDAANDVDLTLDFGPQSSGAAAIERLHAPSLASRQARIDRGEAPHVHQGKVTITVPRASAMRVTLI